MRMNSLSLNHLRLRLGDTDALPQWLLVGLLSGLLTGLVMLAFHHALNAPLAWFLPDGDPENFEALPAWLRFCLPILGSLLLGLLMWRFAKHARVGIPHVLERLSYHQGRLPLPNLIIQFVAAVVSLASGHSGGREGPAVHLGAGTSSLLGQYLRLPNNSLRTLVGCGTAAAIAAAFNTPVAGIIFAMEVVMMEYTVAGFIPVMIAAISATLLLQLTLGDDVVFSVASLDIHRLEEVPFIVLLGIVVGLLAVLFSRVLVTTARWNRPPLFLRLQLAGLLTGLLALLVPEIMGVGYDSIGTILDGQGAIGWLLTLAIAKLLITAIVIGLGVPVGLIGPTLFIGAAAGAALGLIVHTLSAETASSQALYAMLGMGAMMAATLQAPLAALLALLELTLNPNIIFPGALAIITSTLTYRYCFRQGSAFQALLLSRGQDWRQAPLERFLERTAAHSLMLPKPPNCERLVDHDRAAQLAGLPQEWLLIDGENGPAAVLARSDLELFLQQHREGAGGRVLQADELIDLLELPGLRHDLSELDARATLREALTRMNEDNRDALYLIDDKGNPMGLLLRSDINHHFSNQKSE
ncbi:chloride channel protein [Motiliproteus coralliicola]|uniref:Chloride channel protein n=1 Tax=Motiliproteus coralliicola TaxID=2283196 RepID=A0A369W7N5_9GAMM|nr:chloride channel protein [Motiliproteus coralliicola]RDE18018.1 chloride channel protein [Motiliproteus coralliicola]